MPYWDETGYMPELVPLCAAVRKVTEEDERGWKTMKGVKEVKEKSKMRIVNKEVSYDGGMRVDALEVNMNNEKDYPVLKVEVEEGTVTQVVRKTKKMPRRKGSRLRGWRPNQKTKSLHPGPLEQ